ncbi:hypothetical protein KEM52_005987 [Ascosphaera acerosa]|nr:hypothetical protein KEM52_005987 [Ascosphaera acerosa]
MARSDSAASHDGSGDDGPQAGPASQARRQARDEDGSGSDDDARPYAAMTAQTHYVSSRAIQQKWRVLPAEGQDTVGRLLRSVEQAAVSTATRLEGGGVLKDAADGSLGGGAAADRMRALAQAAISDMRRKLMGRVAEVAFPPKTRDLDFQYEAALLESRRLQAHAASVTGSVQLLQAEIDRERALLQKDETSLQALRGNAKRATAQRRREAKKMHPQLAPHIQQDSELSSQDAVHGLFSVPNEATPALTDIDASDLDLYPTIRQLRRHLESMQQNHAQIKGLRPAVEHALAALEARHD